MINENRFTLRATPKAHIDLLKRLDRRAKKLGISRNSLIFMELLKAEKVK